VPHPSRDSARGALVSVAQAADLLGVHPNTIRSWTEAGRLPAYRINARGDRRFRRGDVERLLHEGSPAESAPVLFEGPREAELAVLIKLAEGIGPAASAAAICRSAVEALRSHLAVERVAIYLAHDEADPELRLEVHAGYPAAPPATLDPASDLRETLDAGAMPVDPAASMRIAVSLRAGAELVGALVLEDLPFGPLVRIRRPFLQAVANAIAADVQTARILARSRREVTRARALRHVTQELTGQLDLNAVLNDIADRTRTLFDAEKVGLWLLGEGEHPFYPAASRGIGGDFQAAVRQLRLDSPAVGVQAVRERRTFVVRDADTRQNVGQMQESYRREGIKTACLVPLVSQDRALGVIGLYHVRVRDWPEDELALAQAFANQAAVAISNARFHRSVADQAARMRSIQDLSARLNRLTDVRAIAEAIVAEASTLAAYHDIRVYQVNWETRVCEPVAYTDRLLGEGDFHERLRVDIGEGSFTGWVAEHGEPMLINDALNDPRGHTIDGTDEIEESMLVVPMVFEGRAVGVIALSKLGKDQFSTDDLQTMLIFAGYAAQAIANASAYVRLETQSAELARQLQSQRRLLEINERLLSTLDQKDVLETIADGLRAVVRYDNLSIYRTDHHNRIMTPVLTRERHAAEVMRYVVPFGRGLMGWAVENKAPTMANDALNDPRAMQIPGTPADPEALIVVPLIAEGEVIGCMNISRVGGEAVYFSDSDFELAKLFAGQASIALHNADTHHEVSERADTDALTGLGNHGAFQRDLGLMVDDLLAERTSDRRRSRGGQPGNSISLLMMDLDSFKTYNDRLGHPAGDALLHAVGTQIAGAARADDRVYRYGGDEFALILPGVDAAGAAAVGDRVRQAVARLTANDRSPVTISIGFATLPGDADDKNGLIAAADTALYYAKQSGGDRVTATIEVPSEMRDLRGTLDQLARAALQHPDEGAVEVLVEEAARLSGAHPEDEDASIRDALLMLARTLDDASTATRGHGDRVGNLASRIAARLGLSDAEQRNIELAGRLHGVEILGVPELRRIRSLQGVAYLLEHYRRGGDPSEGPIGGAIVAVANAYDEMATDPRGRQRGRAAVLATLRQAAPARYRRDVVEALATVVSARPDRGQRRRREDGAGQVRGAA